MNSSVPLRFKVYMGILFAILASVLAVTVVGGSGFTAGSGNWAMFTVLLAGTEYVSIYFYDQKARYSLSAAEAIILPMLIALTFPQVVLSLTVANALARSPRWHKAPVKELFNVVQYGCSGIAAASIWGLLGQPEEGFSIANAAAGLIATVGFAIMSHVFVAGAIALTGEGRFRDLTVAIASTFSINLGGSLTFGLLLAAAYSAADWMLFLFALPLAALFFGNRAVLRQQRETHRVESLHAASRALIAGPDVGGALAGFLEAVAEIISTAEARAVVQFAGRWYWSGTRGGVETARMEEVEDGPVRRLLDLVETTGGPVIFSEDDPSPKHEIARMVGIRNGVLVPLLADEEVIGLLFAADRVGPDEFGEADIRLLEAVGNELVVSLESFHLFGEVAEERERFARIFNASTEGICLIDGDGVVRAWNPALERITGYTAADMMGARWSEKVLMRDSEQHRVEGTALVGISPDEVVELVTREGPTRWISVLAGPVEGPEGAGWVVLIRDVSAQYEVEQAKSDFLSTISHELRTPLTTIKGSLQVLERGPDQLSPDLTAQMIGVTSRGAERLERLVMNLLAVSQLESGTMPVFTDEVRLGEVVSEKVRTVLRDRSGVDSGGDLELVVRADRERLGQAIEHLLENALKFGGPNGRIKVEVVRVEGYAQVSVADEGPGIPAADHERIFERFVRLGDILTRETQGAGVGLFIAKRSIDAMDGWIWVESEPGHGSTFYIRLPLARPVVVEQAEPA